MTKNVYKLSSRQLFRHVLSGKFYKPGDKNNRDNAGYIINDLKPETQIVTPDGHERLITKDEWIKVFPVINVEKFDDEDDPKI